MTKVDILYLLALSTKNVKRNVKICRANLGFVGNQSHEVLINPIITFTGKFVMNRASIKSSIDSLMVSPMILTHQVVESRINLTDGFCTLINQLYIQIPMTW
jgi:hypothetical protein